MTEQQQIIKELEALLKRASKAGMKVSRTIWHGDPISVSSDGVRWLAAATVRLEWEPKE